VTWTTTASGHSVGLVEGKVVVRSAAGRTLRSVPSALKDDPVVVGLRQLLEWLGRHEQECRSAVETWMVRSLPVPLAVLAQVWADEAWRTALTDLVVVPHGARGAEPGLLRDADPARGAGLVTLDGDTVWVRVDSLSVPHPVLLADLDELRGFVSDLGVEQAVPQLFRGVHVRGADVDPLGTALQEFSGGRFAQLRHAVSRATGQGYTVRGGYATVRVFEDARFVEARLWIGSDAPDVETETGELAWADERGSAVPLGEVGPVAWSEGVRMAERVHAGRVVDGEEVAA
jgi:hypothetical protein